MLRDPVRVAVTPAATTAERVDQRVIHVERAAKPAMLADLLRDPAIDRALVFTRTKHGADKVVRGLAKTGIAAHAIHGNKSQNQRERVLADFRTGKIRTLIATDIAARGIDVDGISHVVNYDLPNEPESYVHRIGRTARAGATGIAISLCSGEEAAYLRAIEKLIRLAIPAQGRAPASHPHNGAGRGEAARPNGHRPHRGHAQGGRKEHAGHAHGGRKDHAGHAHGGRKEHAGHAHGRKEHGGRKGHPHQGAAQRNAHPGPGAAPAYGQRIQSHAQSHAHSHAQSHGGPQSPAPRTEAQAMASQGGIAGVGFMRRPVPAR
jgi:superfamily II DNA/RNA helicase